MVLVIMSWKLFEGIGVVIWVWNIGRFWVGCSRREVGVGIVIFRKLSNVVDVYFWCFVLFLVLVVLVLLWVWCIVSGYYVVVIVGVIVGVIDGVIVIW